jgi:hypothetical protein
MSQAFGGPILFNHIRKLILDSQLVLELVSAALQALVLPKDCLMSPK